MQPNEIDLSTVQKKVDKLNMHQHITNLEQGVQRNKKGNYELRVTCCLDAGMKIVTFPCTYL